MGDGSQFPGNPPIADGTSYSQVMSSFQWNIPEFFNIAGAVCDRHAVNPGKVAIIVDRGELTAEQWTYAALRDSSNRLANALRHRGVQRGDRIAVLLSQSAELVVAHLAVYKIGAIVVPLFALFGADALTHRLNDSQSRLLITDLAHAHMMMDLRQAVPTVEDLIVVDGDLAGTLPLKGLYSYASPRFDPVRTRADDPAIIIYTSGTTGQAKGALHAHRVLLGHLPGVSMSHNWMPHADDLLWTPADWAWIGGMFDVLFPAMYWGVPVLAHRMTKFDPEASFDLMARSGVRNIFMPPTALKMMRQIPDPRQKWQLPLRTIASGGEPLGQETLDWAVNCLGMQINEFYGQTECNMVVSNQCQLFVPKSNSMGRPAPGHVVSVIDDRGYPVPIGDTGEIAVLAEDPVMFLRYWNNPGATEQKFIGDWLRTGDVGRLDDEGYLFFVGRDDDIISSAGYRIGPAEIEETLVKHPAVIMAAVVGIPDALRGEMVKAFVQLRPSCAPDGALKVELQNWVKRRLGAHEYPREVDFVEEFPMTASGKIQRAVLRRREGEASARNAVARNSGSVQPRG